MRAHGPIVLSLIAIPMVPSVTRADASLPNAPAPGLRSPLLPRTDLGPACGLYPEDDGVRSPTEAESKEADARLAAAADDMAKAEALHRRADLYALAWAAHKRRADEAEARAARLDAPNAEEIIRARDMAKDESRKAGDWAKATIKAYVELTTDPKLGNYPRLDEVLFRTARALVRVKREDLARPIFKRLIKDHPLSRHIPDMYFAFGAYYFEEKQLENALKFFDKVVQWPEAEAPIALCAQYHQGLVFHGLQDYRKALERFVDLISNHRTKALTPAAARVVAAAKLDVVRAFVSIGERSKARPFFEKIGDADAEKMMDLYSKLRPLDP